MFGNWKKEIRGDFGWFYEDNFYQGNQIKAFWLTKVEFVDPDATSSGLINSATIKMLKDKIMKHFDIKVGGDFVDAANSLSLMGFKVAENLGGGYIIVLPVGGLNFLTIGEFSGTPSIQTQPDDSNKSNCFIASAIYGEYSYEVEILRHYRDNYLLSNHFGKLFTEFYYKFAPSVSRVIKKFRLMAVLVEKIISHIIIPCVKSKINTENIKK